MPASRSTSATLAAVEKYLRPLKTRWSPASRIVRSGSRGFATPPHSHSFAVPSAASRSRCSGGADERRHDAPDVGVAEQHRDGRVEVRDLADDPVGRRQARATAAVLDRPDHRDEVGLLEQRDLRIRRLVGPVARNDVDRERLSDLARALEPLRLAQRRPADCSEVSEVATCANPPSVDGRRRRDAGSYLGVTRNPPVPRPRGAGAASSRLGPTAFAAAYTCTAPGSQLSSTSCPGCRYHLVAGERGAGSLRDELESTRRARDGSHLASHVDPVLDQRLHAIDVVAAVGRRRDRDVLGPDDRDHAIAGAQLVVHVIGARSA